LNVVGSDKVIEGRAVSGWKLLTTRKFGLLFSGQPVSMVVRGGDFLFVSGLTAVDLQSGERMQGTTASETRQILTNLKQLLDAAGSSLDKVVKVTIYMADLTELMAMNEVFSRYFPVDPPARTTFQCVALVGGARVEIEAVAFV